MDERRKKSNREFGDFVWDDSDDDNVPLSNKKKGSSTASKKQKTDHEKKRIENDEKIKMTTSNSGTMNPLPIGRAMSQRLSITKIEVFNVDLPLIEKSYNWSVGRKVTTLEASVVKVWAGPDVWGVGEVTPLGPSYLPSSFAAGIRQAIRVHLGPAIIGQNPLDPRKVYDAMDKAMKGENFAKSALDMACWDILGKVSGQPLWRLLGGGKFSESIILYRAISSGTPDQMLQSVKDHFKDGYRKFQLKSGGSTIADDIESIRKVGTFLMNQNLPTTFLSADSNCGWLPGDARRVCNGVKDIDVYIEQPCATFEECQMVRKGSSLPMILDELIVDAPSLLRAHREGGCDGINLKISKVGGLTKAKLIRDIAVEIGMPMIIEDCWGGDVVTAAIVHLAISTPEKYRLASTDFNSYTTKKFASNAPRRDQQGTITVGDAPGLGIDLIDSEMGAPLFHVGSVNP